VSLIGDVRRRLANVVSGPELVNGIDIKKVGILVSGIVGPVGKRKLPRKATEAEIGISVKVGRKVRRMHMRGYSPQDCAHAARRWVIEAARAQKAVGDEIETGPS
jgi:tRNA A-37 threonylcarbamoyl transferase component Bud32